MKNILANEPVTQPKTNANGNANSTNNNANGNGNKNAAPVVQQVKVPEITNPFNNVTTLPGVASRVITVMFALIVIAAVVIIIVSGFRMIVGSNNPEQIKKSKTAIIWALIGLFVAFMSYAIVAIIQRLL